MIGEGISPSGLCPSGDIPITSHLISQSISLNSSQYLVYMTRLAADAGTVTGQYKLHVIILSRVEHKSQLQPLPTNAVKILTS